VTQSIGNWIWPVEMFEGRKPVISDGFKGTVASDNRPSGHLGVDVMFRRAISGELRPPELARHFECPSGKCFVLAPADGTVISAGLVTRGFRVTIDHGFVPEFGAEVVTFYTHMSSLFVAASGPEHRSQQRVTQGQKIGVIGADPTQGAAGLNHLHFEFWDMSRLPKGQEFSNRIVAIDPAPIMAGWSFRGPSGTFIVGSGKVVKSGGPSSAGDSVAGAALDVLDVLTPGGVH
jgi:hypothetical protein